MSETESEEVYTFQGRDGEEIPADVKKLAFKPGIQVLRNDLCHLFPKLIEVTLPYGLQKIGARSFYYCSNLLQVNKIPRTVKVIGARAFGGCERLKKVEFEDDAKSPHQLQAIEKSAFSACKFLWTIKPPSSVTDIGRSAFQMCSTLIEADLSKTRITQVSNHTFRWCTALQTVSLPSTIELIDDNAFAGCHELVTVVVPVDSQPIHVGFMSFNDCDSLAILVLPQGSTVDETAFEDSQNLHNSWGTEEEADDIVHLLTHRFEGFPLNQLCYDHPRPDAQTLRECIRQCVEDRDEDMKTWLADECLTNPFHVLLSTPNPSMELLEVLLDALPNRMLGYKDKNVKRPLDYLINNWNGGTLNLLKKCIKGWMVDSLARSGATKWAKEVKMKAGELLFEDDRSQRVILLNQVFDTFKKYEKMEVTSVLELAVWKGKIKSGRSTDGSKRQALDRQECRCLCGADVVVPNVLKFLEGYQVLAFLR